MERKQAAQAVHKREDRFRALFDMAKDGLFVLVGFWLYFYSNRRSRLIQEVSAKLGLAYHAKDDGSLEQCLNQAFQLEAPLGRDFSQIRDVADAEGIKLFSYNFV